MKINEQLKAMRQYRRMKAKEVAMRSGIPASQISLIENGKVNPTEESIERLVEALDCRVVILPKEF